MFIGLTEQVTRACGRGLPTGEPPNGKTASAIRSTRSATTVADLEQRHFLNGQKEPRRNDEK